MGQLFSGPDDDDKWSQSGYHQRAGEAGRADKVPPRRPPPRREEKQAIVNDLKQDFQLWHEVITDIKKTGKCDPNFLHDMLLSTEAKLNRYSQVTVCTDFILFLFLFVSFFYFSVE